MPEGAFLKTEGDISFANFSPHVHGIIMVGTRDINPAI